MKTRYKLTYEWSAEMVVDVDDEKLTPQMLKDWNEFWGDADDRASDTGGPLIALLKMMYVRLLADDFGTLDALGDFRKGEVEGYPPMDGSCGVTIVSFTSFEFDDFNVEVVEEKIA
jgi:hypothetical protein